MTEVIKDPRTIDTPCQFCCFATYDGRTQVGCSQKVLDKFREKGTEIIEAWNHDGEFFVIKGRSCRSYRTNDWLDRFDNDEEMQATLSIEKTLKFQVLILLRDKTVADLSDTVESLNREPYKPAFISVIRQPHSGTSPRALTEVFDYYPGKWQVNNLLLEQEENGAIHKACNDKRTDYYVIVEAGTIVPPNLLADINNAVNNELIRFAMVEEHVSNIKIIPASVHNYWYFKGDPDKTVAENIEDYQAENPEQKVIYSIQEIRDLND